MGFSLWAMTAATVVLFRGVTCVSLCTWRKKQACGCEMRYQTQSKKQEGGKRAEGEPFRGLSAVFRFITRARARHSCEQLKDTIPSWKKDFVANHFCHNAAHSPNIHYMCEAGKGGKENRKKKATNQLDKLRFKVLIKEVKVHVHRHTFRTWSTLLSSQRTVDRP